MGTMPACEEKNWPTQPDSRAQPPARSPLTATATAIPAMMATGGEESVGGFVSVTAREDGRAFGQEISSGRDLPREDCGL